MPIQAQRGGSGIAPTHPQSLCWKGSAPFSGHFTSRKFPVPIVRTNIKQKENHWSFELAHKGWKFIIALET